MRSTSNIYEVKCSYNHVPTFPIGDCAPAPQVEVAVEKGAGMPQSPLQPFCRRVPLDVVEEYRDVSTAERIHGSGVDSLL